MAKISVLGTGYVGLVTAACFNRLGHEVIGYDVLDDKIETLKRGESPIYEPGLEDLLKQGLEDGTMTFTTDMETAIRGSDVLFVCVGTPQGQDGRADLSQVEAVARTIASHLDGFKLIVEKSTVPVKTAQRMRETIARYNKSGSGFAVASNPEFLREGSAIGDFMNPDRIVIGVEDDRAREMMLDLYSGLDCAKLVVDLETAEIIKHASNSFLALKISYINMVSELCDVVGADVEKVAEGMGLDERISASFLRAGIGYGGSCFPKDVRAFQRIAEDHGVNFDLLRETDEINNRRIDVVTRKLQDLIWVLRGKTIAFWGLAFKPDTDDVREAPSLRLAKVLLDEGAIIRGWDPEAQETFQYALGPNDQVTYHDTPEAAAAGADAVVVVTDWPQLLDVDLVQLAGTMATPTIVDGRNHLDPDACRAAGFVYEGIGRSRPVEEPPRSAAAGE